MNSDVDVWESGVLDEKAMFLLCGEADFKLPAQSVILDRKIKASVNPKTLLALKLLRHRFQLVRGDGEQKYSMQTSKTDRSVDVLVCRSIVETAFQSEDEESI